MSNHVLSFVMDNNLMLEKKDGVLAVSMEVMASTKRLFSTLSLEETYRDRAGDPELVFLPSRRSLIDDLLVLLDDSRCVLLEGESGSGKSLLLCFLAKLHQKEENLIVVHLGEQIDSKVLLGTFSCTAIPGEFVWLPGILTKAVLAGQWIVLEDIDHAPPDVISLLLPLIKTSTLLLPGYTEPLRPAKGFRLFATRRLGRGGRKGIRQMGGILSVLENNVKRLFVAQYETEELIKILASKFTISGLNSFLQSLISTTESLEGVSVVLDIRKLLKLSGRLMSMSTHTGSITSFNDMLLDLIDVIVGHLQSNERYKAALQLKSLCGGLSEETVKYLCHDYKPSYNDTLTTVSIGRAYLSSSRTERVNLCYASTCSSMCLLESIARCVQFHESVLLVGETGVGKTACISYLSSITGNKLVSINLSQQTDSSDLLGGFKPVSVSWLIAPLRSTFEKLYKKTFKANNKFLTSLQSVIVEKNWKKLADVIIHTVKIVRKTKQGQLSLLSQWEDLESKAFRLKKQLNSPQSNFAFAFIEGSLVEAVRNGWWVLLDEVNLASPEALQCLSGLLEGPNGSFLLTEKVDTKPVERHPNFQLFCCMNPSTDINKRSLPDSLRSRFTEFYVDEMTKRSELQILIGSYLPEEAHPLIDGIINFYRAMRDKALTELRDSTGRRPHYSLRTLCRALSYAFKNTFKNICRSIYEGLLLSFYSQLRVDDYQIVTFEAKKYLKPSLSSVQPRPLGVESVPVEGFWVPTGSEVPIVPTDYIITSSIRNNLKNLARILSGSSYPILLQGPTSSGKTSLIQYLAKITGHKCIRINNHEHTDLQEYIGMYTTGTDGTLSFHEGVLVQAMRDGHWLILDELNLAPTDVLEALNRVLDDNRELYITETQQLVKAHPHFLLFGTQNPPGVYGGRKLLSRAFRNRFIELHYDDIPPNELVNILHQKCSLPEKYAKKMVAVMKDLQQRRSLSGIFEGKYGLVTLRDLFRWAERYRRSFVSENFYDWEQLLAEDGFMLLAGRLRSKVEEVVIIEVISKHFKKSVNPLALFASPGGLATAECLKVLTGPLYEEFHHLYWTPGLLKTAVLLYRAIQFDEPTLLIGTTGCGKTTLCQLIAKLLKSKLSIVNCHLHSEAADFLGGLRPIRNRNENEEQTHCLFEWRDGVLVESMKRGQCILIDEISLADDAVLERLNSVLEPERKLLVAERGGGNGVKDEVIAASGFQFMATMNPGGDYGKKELSPALRNRFTEIWSTNITSDDDYSLIIDHNIKSSLKGGSPWSRLMVDFMKWLKTQIISSRFTVTVRDVLLWVEFINKVAPPLSPSSAFINGALMIFIDSLGCGGSCDQIGLKDVCINYLQELANVNEANSNNLLNQEIVRREGAFGIAPFFIETGSLDIRDSDQYCFNANGPCNNLYRLLRGLQLKRPIMLEGAPGVGKTSLVSALAAASGHSITRINLSEHTDVSDLFGSDLPVEGINGIKFEWRDGPFLKALRSGEWILLDEMNLASQSVLEGLNAVLDHRGELYIPELSKTFHVPCCTRLFACQNPVSQGGGRKGLPLSFVNRFTQVYLEPMSNSDLVFITCSIYPDMNKETVQRMVTFNNKVHDYCGSSSLWEFNLRDILRWSKVINKRQPIHSSPAESMRLLYTYRLRNIEMRNKVEGLYVECFNERSVAPGGLLHLSDDVLQIGSTLAKRGYYHYEDISEHLKILPSQTHLLDLLLRNTAMSWMTILVGEGGSGKSSLVRILSTLTGHKLLEYHMNTNTDTSELMGGFEQVNYERELSNLVSRCGYLLTCLRTMSKGNNDIQIDGLKRSLILINNKEGSDLKERCYELKEIVTSTLNILSSSIQNESNIYSDLQDLLCSCDSLCVKVCGGSTSGQFEWINSVLITALTHGYWLLVTQANFCSPSVLDRLNPLLEPNGVLSIDERGVIDGTVPTVKPHKDFRLFLTMDPVHGEISRAMRNRGIEISLLPQDVESLHYDLSSLSYSMSVKCLMSDPVTTLVKRDLHYILIQFINSLNTKNITVNDLLSLQARLRLFIDLLSASDLHIMSRYNALIQLANNMSHAPLLQCVVMATADVLSDDVFKRAARRVSLYLMFILGKEYQSHCNHKINKALHGMQPNEETDFFNGVVESKLLYYTHKRLSTCVSNEWSTAPSLFQSINRNSLSSDTVIDRMTIMKLKEFLDALLTELQCSDKMLSDRAVDCLRLFVFTCHTPDWSIPKLAVSWSLLKRITLAEYELSNNVTSLLESCAVLDQLNSIDARCIQLFRKALGSPFPPASPMQINLMDLLLSATNKYHSLSPPLHIIDAVATTNRSSILQLMTEYHHSGRYNEEQDKEACLKIEKLLTSVSNSQPSSSGLVPDVVRLALNAIPDLFLTASTSYDAELLAEKRKSFIRYCLRVPQWSFHSLLCVSDVTNEAKPIKNFTEWLELLSTDTNLSLSSSSFVTESLSDLTFSLLSPNDDEFAGNGSTTSITVQNFDKKCSELHILLQFLFMKCFTEKSESTKCEQEIQVLKDVLNRILLSLQSVIRDQFDINTVPSDTTHSLTSRTAAVSELFLSLLERNEISGVTWSHFFTSLSSASVSLESSRETREAVETARVAIGEGLVHLLAPISAVDPLVMDNSTNEYLELLVTMNNTFIDSFQSYMNAVAYSVQDQLDIHQLQSTAHQYVASKMNSVSHWTAELNKRQSNLKRFHTERYGDLTEEASRVIQTLVFPGKIHQVLESGVPEREAWLQSIYSAIKRLRENYAPYIDLVQPFIAGLTLLCKGIKELADIKNSLRLKSGCIGMLVRFPYWNESCDLGEQERIKQILEYCHKRNTDWGISLKLVTVAVEMSLSLLTKSKIGIKDSVIFVNVINFCYLLWKEADTKERQRQIEEESIYKYKPITCTISDEEEKETKEINSLFSNYDSYFSSSPDTDTTTSNHTDSESAEIKKSDGITLYQMSETQMRLVKELHELLCYKERIHHSSSPSSLPFHSTPSLSAISLASEMWRGQEHATREESDPAFIIGHARAVHSVLKAVSTSEQKNKSFVIYRDPLVSEARRARVVLIKLKERVNEVLVELPDYPLLKQILFAVDQVLSLDLLSPLMKILAGLENVLRKSQDWEGYACSRLSISTQLSALTELVLEWRRLELNSWSNLLSMCKDDFISQSCKWWFYLYGLINEESLSESDAVTSLQSFIESSSIGDYTNRLRMIESFGLQLEEDNSSLSHILSNVHTYYTQFEESVGENINQLSEPIENGLKDYLKILRWKDGNYWSIKQQSERSHATLSKHIKQYKDVLSQPVKPVLTTGSIKERSHSSEGGSVLEGYVSHLKSRDEKITVFNEEFNFTLRLSEGDSSLSGTDAYNRLRQLLNRYKTNQLLLQWTEQLDEFTGSVINDYHSLQSNEIPSKLSKEEREAAIKLLLMKRKRAFTDLFKTLKSMGLSYRKGEELSDQNLQLLSLTAPSLIKDTLNTPLINDCDLYFFRCVLRSAALNSALSTPSKELSMTHVLWIRGYCVQLMEALCVQREALYKGQKGMILFNHLLERLRVSSDFVAVSLTQYKEWLICLSDCLQQCIEGIRACQEISEMIPDTIDISLTPLPPSSLPPLLTEPTIMKKEGEKLSQWSKVLEDNLQTTIEYRKNMKRNEFYFITKNELSFLTNGYTLMLEFVSDPVTQYLNATLGQHNDSLDSLCFMKHLQSKISLKCQAFSTWTAEVVGSTNQIALVTCDYESMLKPLLLGVQHVMEKEKVMKGKCEEDEDGLPVYKLLCDFSSSNLKEINTNEVINCLIAILKSDSARCSSQLLIPFMEQYHSLLERVCYEHALLHRTLSKMTSCLLEIYTNILMKGFCVPPELMEDTKGGEEFVDQEAGGFDEGEGANDVSENIDRNNLETGGDGTDQSQNEEGRKGDNKGIEMDQDFDGKLEDVPDNNEGDEKENESEDDTAEKEFGAVGDKEEKKEEEGLDRNMWAPEEDEEPNEEELNKESGGGTSEDNETHLAAKESDSKKRNNEEKEGEKEGEGKEEGRDDNDEELINDQDDYFTAGNDAQQGNEQEETEGDGAQEDFGDINLDSGSDMEEGNDDNEGGEEEMETCKESDFSDGEEKDDNNNGDTEEVNKEDEECLEMDSDGMTYTSDDKIYGVPQSQIAPTEDQSQSNTEPDGSQKEEVQSSLDAPETEGTGDDTNATTSNQGSISQMKGPNRNRKELQRLRQKNTSHSKADPDNVPPAKKQKIMEGEEITNEQKDTSSNQTDLYQHVTETQSSDAAAWDTLNGVEGSNGQQPIGEEEGEDEEKGKLPTNDEVLASQECAISDNNNEKEAVIQDEENMESNEEEEEKNKEQERELPTDSFFNASDIGMEWMPGQLDESKLRLIVQETDVQRLEQSSQSQESAQLWLQYESMMSSLSHSLCEELRLILQPTETSQLKGDFRSGKRLNLRRIIPYIASNFQNDRIWLKRVKPNKRNYQILIAVDDSSSMKVNDCDKMTCESLALISSALQKLDSGQLAVCSFGEDVQVLHSFEQPLLTTNGGHILQNLTFNQSTTNFVKLLNCAVSLFGQALLTQHKVSIGISQLMVVLSDGRGVFGHGTPPVMSNICQLTEMGVFVVFVIIDGLGENSIVDIKTIAKREPLVIKSYLETFPFPYYIVLREISALPSVLAQSLRQWFELVTASNN